MSLKEGSQCLSADQIRRLSGQRGDTFQWDHSKTWANLLFWVVGPLLIVVIPVLRVCFLKVLSSDSSHQLVFQPLVVIVGSTLSLVSFLYLSQAIRKHGLWGIIFLDTLEEVIMEVQNEYETAIKESWRLLAKLTFPSLLVYAVFKMWFYSEITLSPLPFRKSMDAVSLASIIILITLSWIVTTTTYLYACILFATVCGLQVLNMVSLTGMGLCLHASSKLSHLHCRIIKAAATVHAAETFEAAQYSFVCSDSDSMADCLIKLYQMQDSWMRRASLVAFLSSSSMGISVYGFVLDRFFIHACIGALLTTTWFILGRSLA